MTVKDIEDQIMMLNDGSNMFKNVGGYAIVCNPKQVDRLKGGGYLVKKGFPIKNISLWKGSSDMIGWKTVTVTEDMVGKKVAIFQSIEIKTKNDRLRKEQKIWNKVAEKAGGLIAVWKENKDGKSINKQSSIY